LVVFDLTLLIFLLLRSILCSLVGIFADICDIDLDLDALDRLCLQVTLDKERMLEGRSEATAAYRPPTTITNNLLLVASLLAPCPTSLGSPRNSALTLVALAGAFVSVFIFPPLALPEPFGPHEVGVFDTYVPLSPSASESSHAFANVRVLFPAVVTKKRFLAPIDTSYYLPEDLKICDEFMQFGGPSFLKNFGFLLHYWHLIRPHFWKGEVDRGAQRVARACFKRPAMS